MLQHLVKSLWKRKTKQLMISAEILLIFVVVFALVVGVIYNLNLYKTPLGFEYSDRWGIHLQGKPGSIFNPDLGAQPSTQDLSDIRDSMDRFERGLSEMQEIESVSFVQFVPYNFSAYRGQIKRVDSDRRVDELFLEMDSHAAKTLGIQMLSGRWFEKQDEFDGNNVAIIDQNLANDLFPGEDPIGKVVVNAYSEEKNPTHIKVIGVVEQYRYRGEFMGKENVMIFPALNRQSAALSNVVIKVKPGTPRSFEIKLHNKLKQLQSDTEYKIATLTEGRDEMLRQKAVFFIPPILIAAFLLIMVCFGLFGVLWQNVNSRIPELGLRRAVGASSAQIYAQIVTEQVLLSSLAMVVGMLFLVQLAFTGIFAKFMDWSSFFISAGIAMAIIYVASIACSLYPAWMASRMNPTDALHCE